MPPRMPEEPEELEELELEELEGAEGAEGADGFSCAFDPKKDPKKELAFSRADVPDSL